MNFSIHERVAFAALDAQLAALEQIVLPGLQGLLRGEISFAFWSVPDAPGRYVWANRGLTHLLTAAACQTALERHGDFLSAHAHCCLAALGWAPPGRLTALNWSRTWNLHAEPVATHLAITLYTVYGARTALDINLSPEEMTTHS